MTQEAKIVLDECRDYLQELRQKPMGKDWKRKWKAAMTSLRSIGNVLQNKDSKISSKMKEVIQNKHQEMKDDDIFKDFIKKERDDLLKENETSAGQAIAITLTETVYLNRTKQTPKQDTKPPEVKVKYVINKGIFEGQNPIDMYEKAINWWDEYLDDIDRKVS